MDIVFFVCLGLFFVFKLKGSFGMRGNDDKIREQTINEFSKKENIVIAKNDEKKENESLKFDFPISDSEKKALETISFDKEEFLMGVEDAVEIVSTLISKKDFENLKMVLTEKLFNHFKEEIDELDKQEKSLQSEVIFIIDKKIDALKIDKKTISIIVSVKTEQMNYLLNKDKKVLLGSKKEKNIIEEKWTFKREISRKETFWIVENVV